MERPRLERLAEAYEVLWVECRLEAFLHRHPSALPISEEDFVDDSGADDETQAATDSDQSSTTNGREASKTPSGGGSTAPVGPDSWMAEWTEEELALLFPSVARRSRWCPDLIAKDLGYTKSSSQVDHLLSLLRRQSDLYEKESRSRLQQGIGAPSKAERKSRRIAKLPIAMEVSDDWLILEESLSARLQRWQDIEDGEDKVHIEARAKEATANGDGRQNTETEEEEEEGFMQDDGIIIGWDAQVVNALLFLRHCSECSPDSNAVNFTYNVPLAAWSGESELELFSFSASLAVDIFANKNLTYGKAVSAYKSFSRIHPTPKTHLTLEGKSKTISWRILVRGVELGLLAWVQLARAPKSGLPDGILPDNVNGKLKSTQANKVIFERADKRHLVWLDTLTGDSRSQGARQALQDAQESATRRLIRSLEWEEALAINHSLTCISLDSKGAEEPPEGSQKPSILQQEAGDENITVEMAFQDVELSSYSYEERNRIRARFRARVARFGREAALAMPMEAQKTGRKRKGEQQDAENARKKRRAQECSDTVNAAEDGAEADDEAGEDEEEEEVTTSQVSEHVHTSSARLPRFEQIGVSHDQVMSSLPETVKDTLELLNVKGMKRRALNVAKQNLDEDGFQVEGISPDSLAHFNTLLRKYMTTLLSCIIDNVSTGITIKGESRKLVSAEDVKAALLLTHSEYPVLQDHGLGLETSVALNLFRSDPPRFYHCETSKRQELQVHLHGLKTLRSQSASNQRHNSIIADAVVSASDAFMTPVLSTYAPHGNIVPTEEAVMDDFSSSEESVLYEDSDEEREKGMQREASRGVPRELYRVDGRVRDQNERREQAEDKRWEQLDQMDAIKAAKYEKRLWASIGVQPKEQRRQHINARASIDVEAAGNSEMEVDADVS